MKPELVVTSDKWSRTPYVVFEGENIQDIIPGEWLDEKFDTLQHEAEQDGEDFNITKDELLSDIEDEFYKDNTEVKRFFPWLKLLVTDDNAIYRYYDDGTCEFLKSI